MSAKSSKPKKHTATPHHSPKQPTRKHSTKKIVFIILALPVLAVVVALLSAVAFGILQKPVLVNKDLGLQNKLHIPQVLEPRVEQGEKVFDLTAQQGSTEFLPGKQTKTLGFNGNYLGPTIRARKGDKIRLNVTNNLDQKTTVHWHGMDVGANMDGGPHQMIEPKEVWKPYWAIANQASTLWYHPHLLGKTGEQMYKGLAGLFIVDDDHADSLNLPKTYGTDDIPVVVQDKAFDTNGQLTYDAEKKDVMGHTGMHGNTILVNGTYAPYVEAPARLVRLRILNASNARRYDFGFDDNQAFHQIATDGGFLERPVALTRLTLAPGERAEIVVDLAGRTKPLTLMSYALKEKNPLLRTVKAVARAHRDENQEFKILEIRPQATDTTSAALPQNLNTIEPLKPDSAIKTRRFVLDSEGHSINGKQMDHTRIDEIIHAGDTEIWEINDQSGTAHPFHIHAVQFQILSRNDKPPAEHERGWKDTVLVNSADTVRVIVRFPNRSDPHLPYMFHCHILEHEDKGMMGQFVLVDKNTKDQDVFIQTNLKDTEHQHIHNH
ncbi:MAG TPA: multicopper oxidase domain-containing protein [Verrucomicrobiae bacterium]|nr:multicopper oxidase domain-containing protein [Verrucomicrobiae bacterium]